MARYVGWLVALQLVVLGCLSAVAVVGASTARAATYAITDLGTFRGDGVFVTGLSNGGQIVGYNLFNNHVSYSAFSYTPAGGIATLPGGGSGLARAVSDSGEIVGEAFSPGGWHAFSYTPAGGMVDLGTPPNIPGSSADAVNDRGQIAGTDGFDLLLWQLLGPPSVSIMTPDSGASYTQDQVVRAVYTCAAAQGASLSSCAAPVPNGQPIDTHRLGSHVFIVTATDNYGQTVSRTVGYKVTPKPGGNVLPAPVLGRVRQSAKRWREDKQLAQITAKLTQPPVGTTFSFTLNIRAAVEFTFTHQAAGRRVGGRCVAQTHKNRSRPLCTRTTAAGALSFTAHAGQNRVRFAGRLTRTKKLNPGSYTLTIVATNENGHRSAPATLRFTIVNNKHARLSRRSGLPLSKLGSGHEPSRPAGSGTRGERG